MSPVSHTFISWLVGNTARLGRRERALILIAGVIPDIDGLGIIGDLLTRNSEHPLEWWGKYHHVLAHNIGFAILLAVAGYFIARQRKFLTAGLTLVSVHIHFFCDIIGARGPEGHQWPIPYLLPFSNSWQLQWSGQWYLNAWPNFVITGIAVALTFFLAWKRSYSPIELISRKADNAFVDTLHTRFGKPKN
jgi:LexA-binding, inner membrane-associated putative hydrolase